MNLALERTGPRTDDELLELADTLHGARYDRYPCYLLEDRSAKTQEAWLRVAHAVDSLMLMEHEYHLSASSALRDENERLRAERDENWKLAEFADVQRMKAVKERDRLKVQLNTMAEAMVRYVAMWNDLTIPGEDGDALLVDLNRMARVALDGGEP